MAGPPNPETLHELDWRGTTAHDTLFDRAGRYPFLAGLMSDLRLRRLLDVGCGSGYLARLVKERVADVEIHGVDVSGVALERARAHINAAWKVDLDREALPVSDRLAASGTNLPSGAGLTKEQIRTVTWALRTIRKGGGIGTGA